MLILPFKSASGSENMADDCVMLDYAIQTQKVCFRHYGWNEAAHTFGYFQQYMHAETLIEDKSSKIYRRPTGGGILSHANDWTYSVAIPSTHKEFRTKACEIYRKIHSCLSNALNKQGINSALFTSSNGDLPHSTPSLCFTKAEVFDVIRLDTQQKLAGAAMKRNKFALLLQGSIDKTDLNIIWTTFLDDFTNELCHLFELEAKESPFPEYKEESAFHKNFNSDDWNRRR